MKQTKDIQCPKCKAIQEEDIDTWASETGEMDGNFPLVCDSCNAAFTVEFVYKPFIKTY